MRGLMTLPLLIFILKQHIALNMSIRCHLSLIVLHSDIFLILISSGMRKMCEMKDIRLLFWLALSCRFYQGSGWHSVYLVGAVDVDRILLGFLCKFFHNLTI